MSQPIDKALELAPGPQSVQPPRQSPLVENDERPTGADSPLRTRAEPAQARAPRGALRAQLTLAFAAAMALCCAPLVVVSCESSLDSSATLRSSVGITLWLFCAATLAAWLVLGRALRPLAQLAASADDIDASWRCKSMHVAGDQIEVHRARCALDRALARLHGSHEALDMFVSNVAHELQDPVTTVLVEAHGLTVGAQSYETLAGFARSTRDELLRIGKIISGSLTLARLDSARQHGTLDPISMSDIALDVVKEAQARAREHNVRLVLMLPESEELEVRGDADLVKSMLENIVSNAVVYSPPGEDIRINLERAEEGLRITVRDRGPGVPELLLPHVLNAHVHGSRKRHGAHGKGLGLAIATRVARYHGGAIRISNHLEGGCEVVIALPLHQSVALT